MSDKTIKIKLIRSRFGRLPAHTGTLKGLGLKKIGQVVVRKDTECLRGMINQISHLVKVEQE